MSSKQRQADRSDLQAWRQARVLVARDDSYRSKVSSLAWRQLEALALSLGLRPAAPLHEIQAAVRTLDPADRRRRELGLILFHVEEVS